MRRAVPDRRRLRGGPSLLVALLVCASCRASFAAPGVRPIAAAAAPEFHAAAKVDTPWIGGPEPRPTASYGSFAAARDSLRALLRRALGAYADSAAWSRAKVRFLYRDKIELSRSGDGRPIWVLASRDSEELVPCLSMNLSVFHPQAPDEGTIQSALEAAGWAMDDDYGADGADGTNFAFVSAEALCFVQASWDGGDDSDTTVVATPGKYIQLQCVPRPPMRPDRRRPSR